MSAADVNEYLRALLRFPVDKPLRGHLVERLVTVRLRQAFPSPD